MRRVANQVGIQYSAWTRYGDSGIRLALGEVGRFGRLSRSRGTRSCAVVRLRGRSFCSRIQFPGGSELPIRDSRGSWFLPPKAVGMQPYWSDSIGELSRELWLAVLGAKSRGGSGLERRLGWGRRQRGLPLAFNRRVPLQMSSLGLGAASCLPARGEGGWGRRRRKLNR